MNEFYLVSGFSLMPFEAKWIVCTAIQFVVWIWTIMPKRKYQLRDLSCTDAHDTYTVFFALQSFM